MTDAYDSTKPSTWPFNLMVLEEENSRSPIHKKAEYTAFTEASQEAIWLCQLLLDNNRDSQPDLEPPLADPTIIYADNQDWPFG